jgi:hypothetical protein
MPQMTLLVAGIGDIFKRQGRAWQKLNEAGVRITGVDVVDRPTGLDALPSGSEFLNLSDPESKKRFKKHDEFTACYIANFPRVHLATAFRFELFAEKFIFAKPLDSNIEFLLKMDAERERSFRSISANSVIQDHYRNKPLVALLRNSLKILHGKHGFVREARVYITEGKSTQHEWHRRGALEDGIILDLAPHALSVLRELLPKRLEWEQDGHRYTRTELTIDEVVGCYRGRDNGCILRDGAETFGAIHIRATEHLTFTPAGADNVVPLAPKKIDILIVVGKGVSIDREHPAQNLKALQITFDGTSINGNFDTNEITGFWSGSGPPAQKFDPQIDTRVVDPNHGGLNLPFFRLAEHGLDFTAAANDASSIVTPFQTFDDAMEVTRILETCLKHPMAERLTYYETSTPSVDVLNRVYGDSKWRHSAPLTHLVIGRSGSPANKID